MIRLTLAYPVCFDSKRSLTKGQRRRDPEPIRGDQRDNLKAKSCNLLLEIAHLNRYLLEIVAIGLLVNRVKQRLRAEPAGSMCADTAICVGCFFITDLDWVLATRARGGFSHELRVAAFLERDEPEDCLSPVSK